MPKKQKKTPKSTTGNGARTTAKASAAGKRKSSPKSQVEVAISTAENRIGRGKFPIVGLGASAGGLEALKTFFEKVPENTGMAFVVVVHMTADRPSMMPELLQKVTNLPVVTAHDGQAVEPGNVYIIPSHKDISIFHGKLHLLEPLEKGISHPIDVFLRSLAEDRGDRCAAVILSGTGTDGTHGVREIKAREGVVFVQSVDSARYDGMPRSAIQTGLVDMVLAPEEMPGKLVDYFRYSETHSDRTPLPIETERRWLSKIFGVLKVHTGHDFSTYKTNTIMRRISRRMGLNHIEKQETYTRYLRENPAEIEALFRELLIGVTSFFRDSESFELLQKHILPKYLESVQDDATIRVWVPGCSTGEEVYSLAIILREVFDSNSRGINLQLFGTDIDCRAIEKAREGLYPASIAADVTRDRLKRFFSKEGDFYRIRKDIRDSVVFSVQDVLRDPPFSRLDMLCCRNLLIYLDTQAQKNLIPLFHYTLNPGGILVLGSSETIGGFGSLFQTLDKKWKIFRRLEVPNNIRHSVVFPSGPSSVVAVKNEVPVLPIARATDIDLLTQKAVLRKFAPTAVLVDGKGEILNIQGRSGKYLEQPGGPLTSNILDMAREGLRIELSSALRTAKTSAGNVTRKRLTVKTNGDSQLIDLHVCPQVHPPELAGCFLVVFEDINTDRPGDSHYSGSDEALTGQSKMAELERELQITRESHQTTIEELESSNEELKSTNEEMQSANEELQSTNEELESSKEELQSLNEELQTVNSELQSKVEELSAAHDDMRNLLNSTEIGTIFVDNDLRIRRYTQRATEIVNLIQTDIGRPLNHVVSNLKYDMIADITEVNNNLAPKQVTVETVSGQWYTMNIIPYRTTDNRIDGAVITFIEVTDQKNTQEMVAEGMRELVRALAEINSDPLVVLDANGKMVIANASFSHVVGIAQDDIKGREIGIIQQKTRRKIGLEKKVAAALENREDFRTVTFSMIVDDEPHKFYIHGRTMKLGSNQLYRILLRLVGQ